ncbi:bystin [Diaphorina citri]|uniref:Bystin n=1 Tax=Diaphorina citri TaxID=121845 RepID=A0A3Q0J411_DIACI|nr:bystin [Diaphorina citri]
MGKIKKAKKHAVHKQKVSLEEDISSGKFETGMKGRQKPGRRKETEDDEFVDSTLSQKILQQVRLQQQELEDDNDIGPGESSKPFKKEQTTKLHTGDSDNDLDADDDDKSTTSDDPNFSGDYYNEIIIDPEDEKALSLFMNKHPGPQLTLRDILREKITEKHTELDTQFSDAASVQIDNLDPKIKQMYEGVRDVLSKYRSGKLPKAFKIVPKLRNWEQILYVTGEKVDCQIKPMPSNTLFSSIPMLHSAAALLKIAEMEYNGANSIFLRILLDKKYALPYRVVDAIVFHFLRFEREDRELPVLWHQSLLTFAQRYKQDVSSEQRKALLDLLRAKSHPTITVEIRRELQSAKCRDVELDEPMQEPEPQVTFV